MSIEDRKVLWYKFRSIGIVGIFSIVIGICVVSLLIACGRTPFETQSSSSQGRITQFKSLGKVPNCLYTSNSLVNACIFGKNPVVDQGTVLSNPPLVNAGSVALGRTTELIGITDVSSLQTHGVYIPGTKLSNTDFSVNYEGIFSPLPLMVPNSDGNWKYTFYNEENLNALNVHTFFWANYLKKKIKDLTGSFYPENQGLNLAPILPFDRNGVISNAFWISSVKLLAFGLSAPIRKDSMGGATYIPLGFDSGIVSHEIGHAILDYASFSELGFNSDLENHCGESQKQVCSKTIHGSPRAIHEGVGDIVSLFLFPESTPIGELFYNDLEGLSHCTVGGSGISRDVKVIRSQGLVAQDFFDACGKHSLEASGEIHAMGSIYSTIWYGVFQKALERGGEGEWGRAYQLFFEHLKNITSMDTFDTLQTTIKNIDNQLFEGGFSSDLDSEYKRMYE